MNLAEIVQALEWRYNVLERFYDSITRGGSMRPTSTAGATTSGGIQFIYNTSSSTTSAWTQQGFVMPQWTGDGARRAKLKYAKLDLEDLYTSVGNAVLFIQNRIEYDKDDKDLNFVMKDLLNTMDRINESRDRWERESLEEKEAEQA